jgi:voltage-gated potassium channel
VVRVIRLGPTLRRVFSLEGIEYAAVLALIVLFGGAAAFSAADKVGYGNSLYWALSTMTTVGYGDVTPHSALAKVIACVMMIFGISFFALVTGAIAQRFLAAGVADAERDVQSGEAAIRSGEQEVLTRLRAIEQQLAQLQTTLQGGGSDG